MTISVGAVTKVRGTHRVAVTFSGAPSPILLTVDGVLAWSGDRFTNRFRNSEVKKNATGWAFALLDDDDTMTVASTITAAAAPDIAQGFIPLPLHGWRECSSGGDVGNIAANGGLLASDTTPTMTGDANGAQCITWAAGNADPICCMVPLPPDFDSTIAPTLDMWVASGTTDAASIGVGTSWDGGALVADANDDSATKSATIHKSTATIAAADVPDGPRFLTIILTPPAHATNAISLYCAGLNYTS